MRTFEATEVSEKSPPSRPIPKKRVWPIQDVESTATLMFLAILVGLGTGLAAVAFIKSINWITHLSFETNLPGALAWMGHGWVIVVPIIGGLIAGPMIAKWAIEAKGHGVPEVMQAIILKGGRIRPRVAVIKSLASSFCIGTGGSAGREGPIVQVGAALGSTAAQLLRLGPERTITLVACGAAAGIAATFNAPIAGVIFAMEVILGEFTTHYFGTVVVAGVCASIVSRQFLGSNPAFTIPAYTYRHPMELLLFALLGVLSALVGWLFVTVLYYLEDKFDPWKFPASLKPAVGAVVVGVTGFFIPHVFGTGLPTIGRILNVQLTWTLMIVLVFAKLLATSFTLGSGNSGGIFSPSLYMGAALGGAFGFWCQMLFPSLTGSPGAYALVGMASVFAASAHAPLTAFLIVFEMSGDYRMILPLMITVGLSTLLSQYMRRYSIYTLKLFNRGIPLERDRDVDLMQGVTAGEVMTHSPDVVRDRMTLLELSDTFIRTGHHGFPVLDNDDRLIGIVTVKDLEGAMGDPSWRNQTVGTIAQRDLLTAFPDEPISKALGRMSLRDVGRMPVVDRKDPGRLVGLLRRNDIIHAYRHAVRRKLESQYRDESLQLAKLTETEIVELTVTPGMLCAGRRIKELPKLPAHALITSVIRKGEIDIAHGETLLEAGDKIVIITQRGTADAVRRALLGST